MITSPRLAAILGVWLLGSGQALADAYKCRLDTGRVSYQSRSCPRTADQEIIRIFDNSTRIDLAPRSVDNEWVAALEADEARRIRALKAEEERKHKLAEIAEVAALINPTDKVNCEKYSKLYNKRLAQGGIELRDGKTGKMRIEKGEAAQEMIESTKYTRDHYCK